ERGAGQIIGGIGMHTRSLARCAKRLIALVAVATVSACAGGDSGSSSSGGGGNPANPDCAAGKQQFASTFESIQKRIFEKHGCTQDLCHGSSKQGGLELSAAVAFDNIFDKPAHTASMKLVEPGDKDRSYLWRKLAAGTNPG